jgi:hypothetical protein
MQSSFNPRIGFTVINRAQPAERVVAFCNEGGLAARDGSRRQGRDRVDGTVVPFLHGQRRRHQLRLQP